MAAGAPQPDASLALRDTKQGVKHHMLQLLNAVHEAGIKGVEEQSLTDKVAALAQAVAEHSSVLEARETQAKLSLAAALREARQHKARADDAELQVESMKRRLADHVTQAREAQAAAAAAFERRLAQERATVEAWQASLRAATQAQVEAEVQARVEALQRRMQGELDARVAVLEGEHRAALRRHMRHLHVGAGAHGQLGAPT